MTIRQALSFRCVQVGVAIIGSAALACSGEAGGPSAPAGPAGSVSNPPAFVDPVTGIGVPAGTPGAVPAPPGVVAPQPTFMDPVTGQEVPAGTPGAVAVPAAQPPTFMDPVTGQEVPAGTPGAVPAPPAVTPATAQPPPEQKALGGKEFLCDVAAGDRPGQAYTNRLSVSEYANSVELLFGMDLRGEAEKLPDGLATSREFNNQSSTVTRAHADQFGDMAATVAGRIDPEQLLEEYANGCDSYEPACTDALITNLGRTVLRGPPVDVEIAGLNGVLSTAQEEGLPFEDAVRHVVEYMLQAPRFVYHIEHEVGDGSVKNISDFELASRVSFAIWGSAPDKELLDLAVEGKLHEETTLQEQVNRLVADSKTKDYGLEFFDDWMDLHRTNEAVQIKTRYPDFDEDLLPDMREETRAAFEYLYDNNMPLNSIFNLQKTFISSELAEHYGLEDQGDGEYDLTNVPERGGLLTQGSMSSLGGAYSSTVRRGLHILGEVLCGSIEDPPPGTPDTETPASEGMSVRDSSEIRVETLPCGGCHRQFEPLIWGLTRYDVAGNYSEVDQFGHQLPEDGWIIYPDDPATILPYSTSQELMNMLGTSTRVRDCATLKLHKYVTRRDPALTDACSLSKVREQLELGSGSYRDIVAALSMSPNFRRITTEPAGAQL